MSPDSDKRTVIVERSNILSVVQITVIPEATTEVMAKADTIAGGTIYFFEKTPVRIGLSGIDWSGGHIQHQEWSAHLNRFAYLLPLASAFEKTGDERYAKAARAYIEDWRKYFGDAVRNGTMHPNDRTLDMSVRLGTSMSVGWGGTLAIFMKSKSFDDAFVDEILASISGQAEVLARNLSGWGNWRVSELDALVFTAIRFPFFENAQRLLDEGIRGIRNGLATQFLPDGVHIERTPGYHDWMMRVALKYYRLAKLFPEADAHINPELLPRSYDYMVQSAHSGINDSHLPLVDEDPSAKLAERREALKAICPERADALPPLTQVFQETGQVFVRSGFKPGDDYLAFDASSWGGVHLHLGRLGFTLRSGGRPLVTDPGILTYEASNRFGPYGKDTASHSTLNVNGLNQNDSDARLLRTEFSEKTALIYAEYAGGYWEGKHVWGFKKGHGRGTHGMHRRLLFWVRGEYLLALDAMESDAGSSVHNVWQMGPVERWQADFPSKSWWSTGSHKNTLVQLVMSPEHPEMECFEGCEMPLRGWVGHDYGLDPLRAPQIEFRYPANENYSHQTDSAVLIVPFDGTERPDYRVVEVIGPTEKYFHTMRLARPDGGEDAIMWTRRLEVPMDTGKPFRTDAPFVWLRCDAKGRASECYVLDGSYLEYKGSSLFDGEARKTGLAAFT